MSQNKQINLDAVLKVAKVHEHILTSIMGNKETFGTCSTLFDLILVKSWLEL